MNISPPALHTLAGESLSGLELPRLLASAPSLAMQARGDGEPVLVLPGYGASNTSTRLLRTYLSALGYTVHGWEHGRNTGNVQQFLPLVEKQLRQLHRESGHKVNMIGWSLGGIIVREVARNHPSAVRQVVTMGSPIVGGPKYTSMGRLFQRNGTNLDEIEKTIAAREINPIRVPVTSIYSKRDGIVAWQASIDKHSPDDEQTGMESLETQ